MRRTTPFFLMTFLCVGSLMSAQAWANPTTRPTPPILEQSPSPMPLRAPVPGRKPGLLERIRRSRTSPAPSIWKLLALSLQPKRLFQMGPFVYWNPRGQDPQLQKTLYRFSQKEFAQKVGSHLLAVTSRGTYRTAEVVVRLAAPIVDKVRFQGRVIIATVTPCTIDHLYRKPKPNAKGRKSTPHDISTQRRRTFRAGNIGHWGVIVLNKQTEMRIEQGRLLVNVVRPSRRRRKTALFYRLSLPAHVLADYRKASATVPQYIVRFRITGLRIRRRFPAVHWMPYPHGGYRHHRMFGEVGTSH